MASTAFIGNDILDIGSRKARREQRGMVVSPQMMMGTPGQFDLPNVADVSVHPHIISKIVQFLDLN
jgi:hypothetical protein